MNNVKFYLEDNSVIEASYNKSVSMIYKSENSINKKIIFRESSITMDQFENLLQSEYVIMEFNNTRTRVKTSSITIMGDDTKQDLEVMIMVKELNS